MVGVTDTSGHKPRHIWVYLSLFFLCWHWDPLKTSCFGGIPISSIQLLTFTVICFLKMAWNSDPRLCMKLALASHAKDPRFNILARKRRQNVTSLLSACLVWGLGPLPPALDVNSSCLSLWLLQKMEHRVLCANLPSLLVRRKRPCEMSCPISLSLT